MSATDLETLDQLHSPEQVELFNAIDKLRHLGACGEVGLPQLVVCGDQSSGKSSVLEGLTRLRFPTKEGLCTTFATELVIRKAPVAGVTCTIKPWPKRHTSEKQRLSSFKQSFTSASPDQISDLITDAKSYMTEVSGKPANAFLEDVLQIEIVGPGLMPLTIVDLPGLIHAPNAGQELRDVKKVQRLVESYMKEPRSIILAVISAKSDPANQQILQYTKEMDKEGMRTLGIITKPDTLDPGSENESSYIDYALNRTHVLYHGWHVVKNRGYQTMSSSDEERDAAERDFFAHGKWTMIHSSNLGIGSLRTKLSSALSRHICLELPSLKDELVSALNQAHTQREALGHPRNGKVEYQFFLSEISQNFQNLSRDALSGSYDSPFFNLSLPDSAATRLRSLVQELNDDFAKLMYTNGHTIQVVRDGDEAPRPLPIRPELQSKIPNPQVITRSKFLETIAELEEKSRGQELPTLPNPRLIADVFREQARYWPTLAEYHLRRVQDNVAKFLQLLLQFVTNKTTTSRLMRELINPAMKSISEKLDAKLSELVSPYTTLHPIIYNVQFNKEVQRKRAEWWTHTTRNKNGQLSVGTEQDAILKDPPQYYSASEILNGMQAYYDVAIQVFISNVTVLAIENCLISKIQGMFDYSKVLNMDVDELEAIAGESVEIRQERSRLEDRIAELEHGCELLSTHIRRVFTSTCNPTIHLTVENTDFASERDSMRFGSEKRKSRSQSRSVVRSRASTPYGSLSPSNGSTPTSSPASSEARSSSPSSSISALDPEEKSGIHYASPVTPPLRQSKEGQESSHSQNWDSPQDRQFGGVLPSLTPIS